MVAGWGRQIDCIVRFNAVGCLPHVLLAHNVPEVRVMNEADRFYR